jgi:hypothetical protein
LTNEQVHLWISFVLVYFVEHPALLHADAADEHVTSADREAAGLADAFRVGDEEVHVSEVG